MRAENDLEILQRAEIIESKPNPIGKGPCKWEGYQAGATPSDLDRLKKSGLIEISFKTTGCTKYLLTKKGKRALVTDDDYEPPSYEDLMQKMEIIVGYDDLKEIVAGAISKKKKINFLLEGPPACAKSVLLECIREAVSKVYLAFGSRTSAAGLSDILFEQKPRVLLMDEADKMRHDVFSLMLGLMEDGEIVETKQKRTRGIILDTAVIAACNSSVKMPREFQSRFAMHIHFPEYSRKEFIDVCVGMLSRTEECPMELAGIIGAAIYDKKLGDIRSARGVWDLITETPTPESVEKVIMLKDKYSAESAARKQAANAKECTGTLRLL